MSDSTGVRFDHAHFGPIEAPEGAAIHCNGLPGFPEARTLLVVEHDKPSAFGWLVCLELPDLALPVTNPRHYYPDYVPRPHHADLRAIRAREEDPIDLLVVANATAEGTFLNLAAPLLVNRAERLGIQAILAGAEWPVRAPLRPSAEGGPAQIESNPHR